MYYAKQDREMFMQLINYQNEAMIYDKRFFDDVPGYLDELLPTEYINKEDKNGYQ